MTSEIDKWAEKLKKSIIKKTFWKYCDGGHFTAIYMKDLKPIVDQAVAELKGILNKEAECADSWGCDAHGEEEECFRVIPLERLIGKGEEDAIDMSILDKSPQIKQRIIESRKRRKE